MNIRIMRSSRGGKNKILLGSILCGLFGLSAVGCAISPNKDELTITLLICAGAAVCGFFLLIQGINMNKKSKIANRPSHEFDMDAPDFVKDRLNELMFEGSANTATISKTVKRVSYTGPDGVTHTTETVTQSGGDVTMPRNYRAGTVTCQACGGINKLRRGQGGVCEYCGSHIQG